MRWESDYGNLSWYLKNFIFHRKLHKQYGDLFSIKFFHQHLIFVGGYKTTNELLVRKGDVLGEKPYFFVKQVFRNAGTCTMILQNHFKSNNLETNYQNRSIVNYKLVLLLHVCKTKTEFMVNCVFNSSENNWPQDHERYLT